MSPLRASILFLVVGCGSGAAPAPPTDVPPADVPVVGDLGPDDIAPADVPADTGLSDVAQDRTPLDAAPDVPRVGVSCQGALGCTAPTTCDRGPSLYTRGLCTRDCAAPRATPAAQLAACGFAGSTCLAVGFFAGRCVTACDPAVANVCHRGHICSWLWFDPPGAAPDEPGCVRFCRSDDDCLGDPFGTRCHRRLGVCDRSPEDPTLLPDGAPCNPSGIAQCRGFCLEAVDADPSHGICASLIDRTLGDACPDSPTTIAVRGASTPDQVGLCAFQRCDRNCECRPGLVCIYEEGTDGRPLTAGGRTCRYATPTQRTGVACP